MADFDPRHTYVTSPFLTTPLLAGIRGVLGLYTLVSNIVALAWTGIKGGDAGSFFSYFTNLSFIGLTAYFFASTVQTVIYLKSGQQNYPLQRWPSVFRYLHRILFATIVTYPLLTTIVYWALLGGPESFETPYSTWANISRHAFNTVFAIFEITFSNVDPMPWIDLVPSLVILGGYLGLAYITHETQGFYSYSFLDPKKEGKMLAVYIVGIAIGEVVIFVIVWGAIWLRRRLSSRSVVSRSAHDIEGKGSKEKLEHGQEGNSNQQQREEEVDGEKSSSA